jgi:hypothetical protein
MSEMPDPKDFEACALVCQSVRLLRRLEKPVDPDRVRTCDQCAAEILVSQDSIEMERGGELAGYRWLCETCARVAMEEAEREGDVATYAAMDLSPEVLDLFVKLFRRGL